MKKVMTGSMIVLTMLINGGFFPVINFNPENPVKLNILMQLIILFMAAGAHYEVGLLETKIHSQWSVPAIAAFNICLVAAGLFGRYLLEFGETSNTYNFTWYNILFQIALLSLISTGTYLFQSKQTDTENG